MFNQRKTKKHKQIIFKSQPLKHTNKYNKFKIINKNYQK